MYSKAALLEIFQNILQSISSEEKSYIEFARPLLDLIKGIDISHSAVDNIPHSQTTEHGI